MRKIKHYITDGGLYGKTDLVFANIVAMRKRIYVQSAPSV
jgi:hypothetical protein